LLMSYAIVILRRKRERHPFHGRRSGLKAPSRLRSKPKVAGVTIGLAVPTLVFLGYSFYPWLQSDSSRAPDPVSANESSLPYDVSTIPPLLEKIPAAQPVFPYSVIPGGARSSRELSDAARREPVVAAHYAEFSVAHTRVIRLPYDKLAFVSYRLGNHIYWTKTKVTLHQGETLLSDGEHLARTRCGNRVSDVAMTPVSPQEPPQKLLSTPLVPAHVNVDPAFRTDGPLWPENAAAPALVAMHDMPPAPGSGPGFPPLLAVFCCRGKSSPSTPSYPLPQPGYPPPPSVTTPEPGAFLLLLSGLVLLPFLIRLRRIH
jgi:hypothetical protein